MKFIIKQLIILISVYCAVSFLFGLVKIEMILSYVDIHIFTEAQMGSYISILISTGFAFAYLIGLFLSIYFFIWIVENRPDDLAFRRAIVAYLISLSINEIVKFIFFISKIGEIKGVIRTDIDFYNFLENKLLVPYLITDVLCFILGIICYSYVFIKYTKTLKISTILYSSLAFAVLFLALHIDDLMSFVIGYI